MSNIQLTLYPPNTQIIDVQPSETITLSIADNANIYASEILKTWKMDGTSAGDFTPRTNNVGTPGGYFDHPEWFDYTSGSLVVTPDGSDADNWWLHSYPFTAVNIFKNDHVINWTGKVIDMDIANSYFLVGAYLTHHGDSWDSIGQTLQMLVGFRTTNSGTNWKASVWRRINPIVGDDLYEEAFSFDTGVSAGDTHTLQVAICDKGTKALFYVDGSLVATTNEMPVDGYDASFGSAYTGCHFRPFDTNTYQSSIQTDSMETVQCISGSSVSVASRLTSVETLSSIGVSDLNDVVITSLSPNDMLVYNVGSGKWVNQSRTGFMSGYTLSYSSLIPSTAQQATSKLVWWNAASGITRTLIPSATGLTTLTFDETANTMVIDTPTTAGGDLTGSYPNPTVDKIQGVQVQAGTPTDHDVLIYSASPAKWQHQSYATAGISEVGHTHAASDVTSGTFAIARIPTGTTSTTVSLGNHTHTMADITDIREQKIFVECECNSAGEFTSISTNSGANSFSSTGIDTTGGHYGILTSTTATTSNAVAGLGSADTTTATIFGTFKVETTSIVMIPTLSNGTDRFFVESGFTDNRTGTPTDGALIQYCDNVNSGKFFGLAYNNTTSATVDLGITVAANTWYKLNTIVNTNGSVDFYIDGVLKGSLAAGSAPSGSSRATSLSHTIRKSVGTSSKTLYIDYINYIVWCSR